MASRGGKVAIIQWTGALLRRLSLFLIAGATAVLLLHVQAGITPAAAGAPAGFSASRWLAANGEYLRHAVRGDLGLLQPLQVASYTREKPVTTELADRAPASLVLLLLALVTSLSVGTLLGILTSRFGVRWLRTPTTLGTMALLSTPDILVVMGLRMLVVWGLSTLGIKLFSLSAYGAALHPSHFVAPTIALAALPTAVVARVAAVAFDEIHGELYIRTALAKGVTHLRVVLRHALKNAWIRVAEASPLIMASLVTGLVVVEYILYFPGVGRTLGLILEKGGQPGPSTGIALVLLLFAALIDVAFATVRLALDPRLKEQAEGLATPYSGGEAWYFPGRLADGLRSLGALPATLAGRLRAWPYAAINLAWAWRPGRLLGEILRNPPLLAGLTGVGALAMITLFGGHFLDLSTAYQVPRYIISDGQVFFPPYQPGTPGYPLGSDMAGRDLLVRLIVGARYTLFFTLAVTPVRFLVAVPWGLAAGLRGGLWRSMGRTLGLVFSALPVLLIPAALLPLVPVLGNPNGGSAYWLITAVLALAGVPRLVEQIRQHTESLAVQPFVEGAVAVGADTKRIFWRHLFPHLTPQLWVTAAADMAWTLLLLAQFGVFSIYLAGSITVMTGFEIMGDTSVIQMSRIPDWSSMLSRPYDVIFRAPWSIWLPAFCFLLAIIAFNLVAEGLRRRSQQFHSMPTMAEVPNSRRRLVLEWSSAASVLVLAVVLTLRFGLQTPTLLVGTQVESPLERARLQLTAVLEQASGTAPDNERSRALSVLKPAVTEYLKEIQQAGLPLSTIVTDTQGRFSLVEGPEFHLLNVVIPNPPANKPSYVFVYEKESGWLIDQIATLERVQSFTVLRKVGRTSQNTPIRDFIILAGPMPQEGDRWGLSVWAGSYGDGNDFIYGSQEYLIRSFHETKGRVYGTRTINTPGVGGEWLALPDPVNRFEVAANGDLNICLSPRTGECTTFPWLGRLGWGPPKQ